MSVENCICNGFLAYAKQGIGDSQRQIALAAGTDRSDSNGGVSVDQAVGAVFKSAEQPHGFQVLRAQGRNAAPGFFMTAADHVARHFQLGQEIRILSGIVMNRLKLKTDAGRTLGEGIMHLVSEAPSLLKYSLHAPAFNERVGSKTSQGENERPDDQRNDMACAPPGRTFNHFDIVWRWQ